MAKSVDLATLVIKVRADLSKYRQDMARLRAETKALDKKDPNYAKKLMDKAAAMQSLKDNVDNQRKQLRITEKMQEAHHRKMVQRDTQRRATQLRNFRQDLDTTKRGIFELGKYMINPLKLFESVPFVGRFISGVGGYMTLAGMGVFHAIKEAAVLERYQTAFSGLTRKQFGDKSPAVGAQLVDELRTLGAESPFSNKEIMEAAQMLLGYETAVENVIPTLKMLGDVSAAMGARTSLEELTYLFGTTQQQAHVFTRDINQFGNRGIPILGALAEVMGKNKDEIMSMVEAGKVGFPEILKAFKLMSKEDGMFHGFMARQAKTLYGLWMNIIDLIEIAAAKIGTRMVNSWGIKDLAEEVQAALRDTDGFLLRHHDTIQFFLDALQSTAKLIGAIGMSYAALITRAAEFAEFLFPKTADSLRSALTGNKDIKLVWAEYRNTAIDAMEMIAKSITSVFDIVAKRVVDLYNIAVNLWHKVAGDTPSVRDYTAALAFAKSAQKLAMPQLDPTVKNPVAYQKAMSEFNQVKIELLVEEALKKYGQYLTENEKRSVLREVSQADFTNTPEARKKAADSLVELLKSAASRTGMPMPVVPMKLSDDISQTFGDFRKYIQKKDREADAVTKVYKFMAGVGGKFMAAGFGAQMQGPAFTTNREFVDIPRLGATAKQYSTEVAASAAERKEFSVLMSEAMAGLVAGTLDKSKFGAITALALDKAEKLYGLDEPRFAGGVLKGTAQAYEIEQRWRMFGDSTNPENRILRVLEAQKTYEEQTATNTRDMANAMMNMFFGFPGGGG